MAERIHPTSLKPLLAFILAVSLALVGILAAFRPGQVYPFTLEFGSLGLVTYVILGWERDARVRLWLSGLVAGALALRALLILAIHGGLSPYLFAPDAATYEYFGRGIVDHWRGLRELPTEIVGRWQVAHYYVNALFLYLFGNSSLGTVVLNAFLGAWTAVLSFYLGREVLGERVGRWAAMLTAFYPSLALWSVLNIREAPTTLLVTGVVTVAVVSLRRSSGLELFLLMAGVVVLSMYRDYMAFLVTAGCLLGLFAGTRRGNKMRVLVVGSVLVFFATFAFASLGIFERVALENPLQTATLIREDLQRGAGSAFGLGVETLSFGQALRFLPFGLAHLLFAP
ncbi:MAG TPA: glycosyltransferase family 39 protein, partial [Longimicrobiales bacterium]